MTVSRPAGESTDHRDLRELVERLCSAFTGDYWRACDRDARYPVEFVRKLTDAGLLACLIPEEYGGSGLPLSAGCVVLEEIQRSGGNAGACHAQMYTMGTILRHGSAEQKETWLPGIASGELRLQAFGITEPDTGTDTTAIRTFARRTGDAYTISGQKVWTSRAAHSDLMLLLARTTPRAESPRKTDGMSVFVIDMRDVPDSKLTIRPLETMINHATCEVFFDDLVIPVAARIGEEGEGFRYILSAMNAERILIAAECIGDARFFIDRACSYASSREVFGRPIAKNQGVQFPIAQAYAHTEAAALMVGEAARLFDAGAQPGSQANMAKLLAADASWEAADVCMQVYGGYGFATEYDVERKWREARLYRTAPVSTNMILAYLAEHVLGLPRSY